MTPNDNYEYFKLHQEEFQKTHFGKYVLISENEVQGFFDDFDSAYRYATNNFELGSFVIQHCVADGDDTVTFYSPLYK